MRKIFYLLIIIAGVTLLAKPKSSISTDKETWIRIDSLEAEGLYKSALTLTEQVYYQARNGNDPENEIKALIYRLKYIQLIEEEGQIAAITVLGKELPDERLVQGSIKYSILAELYYRYFSANRWQISQNPNEDKGPDQPLKTWSPERFYQTILDYYSLSLRNGDRLAQVKVGSLAQLWTGNLADTLNKPALYHVLISRALDFLQNAGEFSLSELKPPVFGAEELFSEPSAFIQYLKSAEGSGSNPFYRALQWYGDWLSKSEKTALLTADLKRLDFVRSQSWNHSADRLYESALLTWALRLGKDSSNAIVHEAIAQYHLGRGELFRINGPDTQKYSLERRMAAEWLGKSGEWSGTLAGKRCRNLLSGLMKPELNVQSEPYQIPQSAFPVSVEYRNMGSLQYGVYRLNARSFYSEWGELEQADKLSRISRLKPVRTGKTELPDDGRMNPHRVNVIMDPLPSGFYLLVFSNQVLGLKDDKLMVMVPVSVSGTTLISRQGMASGREFYFRDRNSGAPLEGCSVVPWYVLYDQQARRSVFEKGTKLSTGDEGFLLLPDGGPGRDDPAPKAYRLEIVNRTDTLLTRELFYPGYYQGKSITRTSVLIYTDRSLYKPGNEAFFRGVLLDYHGDSLAIHQADSIELSLQDPRYQVVGKIVLPVDKMGVFTGSVMMPPKGLTGTYLIQSKYGQAAVRMEQYRRPAFSVLLSRGTEIFLPGSEMQLTGEVKALSGEPVSGASIEAGVDLQPVYGPRRWSPFAGQKIRITTIRSTTDALGRFSCRWTAIPEGSSPFGNSLTERYSIVVKVTDLNGETHMEETFLDCGKGTVSLSLDFPGRILAGDTLAGMTGAICSDGRPLDIPVNLKVIKLNDPGRTWADPVLPEPDRFIVPVLEWREKLPELPYKNEYKPSSWTFSGVAFEKSFTSDTIVRMQIPHTGKWQTGWYRIELVPADTSVCKRSVVFLRVEDPDRTRISEDQVLFALTSVSDVRPGQNLEFAFGSGRKGFLLVDLQKRIGSKDPRWYGTDQKIKRLTWKVTSEWEGGAVLRVVMLQANRLYEKSIPVNVPWENSKLRISGFEQLNTVKPGDSLSVQIKVEDERGAPVRASVGVTVYDASLDLIAPNNWPRVSRQTYPGGPSFLGLAQEASGSLLLSEPKENWVDVSSIEPVTLNWFGLGYYGIGRMDAPVMKMAVAQAGGAERSVAAAQPGAAPDQEMAGDQNNSAKPAGTEGEANISPLVIRKDFRETAVFEGNLMTDEQGVASLKFKVPEVFTGWKVLATGHSRSLAFGSMEHHFRSAKELMLKPNLPAFIRKGDTVELSARLGWYGKGSVETVTTLILSDTTGKRIKSYPDFTAKLTSGGVTPFSWQFVADKSESFNFQLQSITSGFSDGLKDSIRVYPDQVQLWTAQPFFFPAAGRKKLAVEPNPVEAVFEVTTNPAWQVLQSLPVVDKQERDCSEYWFSRLYLASLTGNIADKYPGVAARFLGDSVPEKQKDRILQIREWMNPATRAFEMAYVLEKLSDLQNADGTWPWYRGMGSDQFMTQQIIAGFGEMKAWRIFDISNTQRGDYMLTRAIGAMDNWLYRQFREVIRADSVNPVKVQLNPLVIHYLYARSFFPGLSLAPANEIAWIHFIERIPVEWTNHGIGLQALMAIASAQTGHMTYAMPIYKSLRERARIDEQWGMYWPRKGYGSSWFEWDLWMQSRMIELFSAVEEGRKDLDQLKMYLIHQKRGRDWGNGMIAAWASKSLLYYGTDLALQPATVEMTWGSVKFSASGISSAAKGVTGYFRQEWKNPAEIPASRSVEVVKSDGGPAWGTLFTLGNYNLDKLSATGGPLRISRMAMIRDNRGTWMPLLKGRTVHVGDIIRIKLTVQSDRELSYIEVRDNLGTGIMPVQVLSGYQYNAGLSYYQSREPESLVCYVSQLPKGSSSIEYQAVVEQAGSYFGGYATATSLYAPEFRAWSDSFRIHSVR